MESWMRARGYSSSAVAPNFVSLFGGKFFVPAQSRPIVFAKLAYELSIGSVVGLCECSLPVMNLYFDIDKCPRERARDWMAVIKEHVEAAWECDRETLDDVIVCVKSEGDGCHIHWPGIIATRDDMRAFADMVASSTSSLPGVLDSGVYRAGLRMVGCRKQKASTAAYYAPMGEVIDSIDTWKSALGRCSIHPTVAAPTSLLKTCALASTVSTGTCCSRMDVPVEIARVAMACFPVHFRTAPITSIVKIEDVVSIGLGTKRCLNLSGAKTEHSSNHVYIVVTPDGAYQKCHNTTTCKNFRSQLFYVPRKAIDALFPDHANTKSPEPSQAASSDKNNKKRKKMPRIAPPCLSPYVREFSRAQTSS